MSLEYEGQAINSMKWNGQEILGGGDSGGGGISDVVTRVDVPNDHETLTYTRFKKEEDGLYYVLLHYTNDNYPENISTNSWNSWDNGILEYNDDDMMPPDVYQVPEGFRPVNLGSRIDEDYYGSTSSQIYPLFALSKKTFGFGKSDFDKNTSSKWAILFVRETNSNTYNRGIGEGWTCYQCDYTGE